MPKSDTASERPTTAGVLVREERVERETRLAHVRKVREAAEREHAAQEAAREAAAREAAAREAAAREAAQARQRDEMEAARAAEIQKRRAGLGQDEIQAVVSSAHESFQKCIRTEKENGSWNPFSSRRARRVKLDGRGVVLRVNVQPEGKVTYPTFDDVTLRGTDLGSCLTDAAKAMTFPAFEGKPQHVDIPLVLHE